MNFVQIFNRVKKKLCVLLHKLKITLILYHIIVTIFFKQYTPIISSGYCFGELQINILIIIYGLLVHFNWV